MERSVAGWGRARLVLVLLASPLACAWLVPSGTAFAGRRHKARSSWAPPRGTRGLEGGAHSREDKFLAWAQQRGITAPKIRLAEFPPGYRGVAAREPIAAGEPLVVLPRGAALCVGDRQPTPFPEFVGAAFWNQQSMHVRLALVLLHERERARRGRSPMGAWLEMLPASHADKPCRWPDAQLDDLCDPLLADEIRQQSTAISTIHHQLVESAAGSASSSVSLADFEWAMDTVISRTFGANIPAVASPGVWQTVVLVLFSHLARKFPSVRSWGPTWLRRCCDGSATSNEVLLMEPLVLSLPPSFLNPQSSFLFLLTLFLAPSDGFYRKQVDMFNHHTEALSDTNYNSATDSITLRSLDSDWKQGQEVCFFRPNYRAPISPCCISCRDPALPRVASSDTWAGRSLSATAAKRIAPSSSRTALYSATTLSISL